MIRFKYLPLIFFAFDLHAGQLMSGVNSKDFNDAQKKPIVWKNNPFMQHLEDPGTDELTLLAIVYSEKKARALINDQIVKNGDEIGSFKVVSIQRQRVILRNENGIFSLQFKRKKNEKT